jgi:tetratricopeptide (TPR) repeat protein
MADFFLSYNGADASMAGWIAWTLRDVGYSVRFAEWELSAGYDIAQWMAEALEDSSAMICVASPDYIKPAAKYSALERAAMLWQDVEGQAGRLIFVKIRPCTLPKIFGMRSYISITGKSRDEARSMLLERIKPPSAPTSEPAFLSEPAPPTKAAAAAVVPKAPTAVPAREPAFAPEAAKAAAGHITNIPVHVPQHFLGRKDDLAAIDKAFTRQKKRLPVTVLHGLRGVGKSTLAAAYAERRREEYRAVWWIRAQTPEGMRADLVGLGARLGWIPADAQEEPALPDVLARLAEEGDDILLIYDNAIDADSVRPFLPKRGEARVLVTSNFHAWRGLAEPVEIRHWPKGTGADYLIARTGREEEREAAEKLSDALGGLPLAHEQAAAYCERLSVPLAEYLKRLTEQPAKMLDDARHAPADYHDGLTVAKTFALAIAQAAALHPAAEPLLRHAAALPAEPIPLFLFADGLEEFDEPLKSALAGEGLDEALAALSTFALIERESVPDERDATITTECFRLHRLVRHVAAEGGSQAAAVAALVGAVGRVIGEEYNDPAVWPRWRRVDMHAAALAEMATDALARGALFDRLASYRHNALAAYDEAQQFYERALAAIETLGTDHPKVAVALNNLAGLQNDKGDLAAARTLHERALKIVEATAGPSHPDTAVSLNNLAVVIKRQGDLDTAQRLYERALAIDEAALGPENIKVAVDLNNLGVLLQARKDFAAAMPVFQRALAIKEKALGPKHFDTAISLNNLAGLLVEQGSFDAARPLVERALETFQGTLGKSHPSALMMLENLAAVEHKAGRSEQALLHARTALTQREAASGTIHGVTQGAARIASLAAEALDALSRPDEAAALRAEYGLDKKP